MREISGIQEKSDQELQHGSRTRAGSLNPEDDISGKYVYGTERTKPSSWSTTGEFVTGLFDKKDWSGAKWIGYEEIPDSLLLVPGVHGTGDNLGTLLKKEQQSHISGKSSPLRKRYRQCLCFCKRTWAI